MNLIGTLRTHLSTYIVHKKIVQTCKATMNGVIKTDV